MLVWRIGVWCPCLCRIRGEWGVCIKWQMRKEMTIDSHPWQTEMCHLTPDFNAIFHRAELQTKTGEFYTLNAQIHHPPSNEIHPPKHCYCCLSYGKPTRDWFTSGMCPMGNHWVVGMWFFLIAENPSVRPISWIPPCLCLYSCHCHTRLTFSPQVPTNK